MIGDKIIIEITEGQELSSLELIHSDGKREFKTISFDDFLDTVRKEVPVTTGLLPPGTRIFSGGDKTFSIIIEQPPLNYQMNFNELRNIDLAKLNVPVPATLFGIRVQDNQVIDTRIACFIPPLMREAKELYYFPYGNADPKVCWGSARPEKITGINGIYSVIASFMDSHFNGHLITHREGFETFITKMSGEKEFPTKELKRMGITFSEFKRSLFTKEI